MRREKGRMLFVCLLWAGFTALTVLAMLAFPLGADPGMGLLRHAAFTLRYSGTGLRRLALVGAGALAALLLGKDAIQKGDRPRLPAVLLGLFFAWNTVIWLSTWEPKALDGLLWLPGAGKLENLLFYAQLTLNYTLLIDFLCRWLNGRQAEAQPNPVSAKWVRLYAVILLLGWLPILILRSPGSFYTDTAIQVLMYQGKYEIHASMPVLLTYTYGLLFDLGRFLGGDNGGILACTVFQTALLLFAMTAACREAGSLTERPKVGLWLALFFGILPIYPTMAQGIIKDSIHGAIYLLFLIHFGRVVRGKVGKELVWLLVLAVLVSATRKGGVYLAAISLIALGVYRKDTRRVFLSGAAAVLAISAVMNGLVYPAIGIGKPMERENYSLLYPITAYYCQTHSQELTPEEIQIIGDVLDYDTVRTGYSTVVVDGVKNTFHAENQAQVRKFLLLNGKFFLKHPVTCLEAVVYSKNLYYTPFSPGGKIMYVLQEPLQDYSEEAYSDFSFYLPDTLRQGLEEKLEHIQQTFPVRVLCSPGLYSWLTGIALLAAVFGKRKDQLLSLLPVGLLVVGLLLSHINGAVRYAFPVMACIPYFLAVYPVKSK